MKKLSVKRNGSKKLNPLSQKEQDKKLDELNNPEPYKPTEMEILLHAIEAKAGITQADKDTSRQAIIDAKAAQV